jgi:hypothetical protein
MVAYSAVSFLPKGAEKAQLGTVKLESDTVVAVSERLVRFPMVKVTEATFATLDRDQLREVVTQITDRIPDHERVNRARSRAGVRGERARSFRARCPA